MIKLVVQGSKAPKKNLFFLLQAIAFYANDQGFAWPSEETLGQHCQIDKRQIQRLLPKLAELGEITIVPNAGPRRTNGYQLNIEQLERSALLNQECEFLEDRSDYDDISENEADQDSDVLDSHPDQDSDILGDDDILDSDIFNDQADQDEPIATFLGGIATFSTEDDQKCRPNHVVNHVKSPPPPCEDEFFGDRDPVELLEQQSADDFDDQDWGGGDEYEYEEREPDVWVERQTAIPRSVPKIPNQLVGLVGGGDWQADSYERSRVDPDRGLGGESPPIAPPPHWSMQWPQAREILQKQYGVQLPDKLRDLGIPYELVIRQAKALAKTGGGGGAIIRWFKQPENVEHLRAEATKPPPPPPAPQQQAEDRSPSMDALDKNAAPVWADRNAWLAISWQARAKLKYAVIKNGWVYLDSRRQQQLVDTKYYHETIELLEASGIELHPPAAPPAQRPAVELIRSHYSALLKREGNDHAA